MDNWGGQIDKSVKTAPNTLHCLLHNCLINVKNRIRLKEHNIKLTLIF